MIRVMVVDSNITRAGLTARGVRELKFGAKITYALSVVQALFYIAGTLSDRRKTLPDIITLADPLADTRGSDAIKAIHEAVAAHGVSIIVNSEQDSANAMDFYKLGAAAFVNKKSEDPNFLRAIGDAVCFTSMVMGLVPKQSKFFPDEEQFGVHIKDVLQIHL